MAGIYPYHFSGLICLALSGHCLPEEKGSYSSRFFRIQPSKFGNNYMSVILREQLSVG
jgi:hypothetical protein